MAKIKQLSTQIKTTLTLALPIVFTQLAHVALNVTDTIMAGRLSATDLAAIAIGNGVLMPIIYFSIGVLVAINPIVSHLFGAGQHHLIGKKVFQGFWISIFLAIPTILFISLAKPLLSLMNIGEQVAEITQGYLGGISLGVVFFLAFQSVRSFNDGVAHTRATLYVSLGAIPLNILANYCLMYGNFGFPRMGAVGTGYATAFIWLMMFVCLSMWSFYSEKFKSFQLFQFAWPDWADSKEIMRIGAPIGAGIAMETAMFAVIALFIGSMGTAAVASHQVALSISSIAYMVPLGISIAITTLVGQSMGRGDKAKARLAGYVGIGVCICSAFLLAALMAVLPDFWVGIYTHSAKVHGLAVQLILLAALFQLSDGLQVSALGALRGLKDTRIPFWVNAIAYWAIGTPLGYILCFIFNLGVPGFWYGMIAGLSVAALLHSYRFYHLTQWQARVS